LYAKRCRQPNKVILQTKKTHHLVTVSIMAEQTPIILPTCSNLLKQATTILQQTIKFCATQTRQANRPNKVKFKNESL